MDLFISILDITFSLLVRLKNVFDTLAVDFVLPCLEFRSGLGYIWIYWFFHFAFA